MDSLRTHTRTPGPQAGSPDRLAAAAATGEERRKTLSLYERGNAETWIMAAIGLIAFAVYFLTLAPGVLPGASAVATGKALGLLPSVPATHPLWLLAARSLAKIPVFDTVHVLNLFSAACGSLAVAWLFRIVKRILFEFIREEPSIRLVPVGETGGAVERCPSADATASATPSDGDAVEHVVSTLGGVVAAIAFAFSTPFWIASTALHIEPFTLLLLLVTADRLACYHFTGRTSACVAAVFLLGLGLAESVVFLVVAPLALLIVLLSAIRYSHISESFILLTLATGASGLAANLLLFLAQSDWGPAFHSGLVLPMLAKLANAHSSAFTAGLPNTGWVFVCLQTTGPVLLALVSLRVFYSHQDEVARWKWALTNLALAGLAMACLLNLPHTAWSAARAGGHLPVMPTLSIAVATGAVFAFWCLFAAVPKRDDPDDQLAPSLGLRLLGFGVCGLLCVITLRAINANMDDADARKTAFADQIATAMLEQAGSARCLVTDGTLDMNLIIRSHLSGRKQTFLPNAKATAPAHARSAENKAPFRLSLPEAAATRKAPPTAFVEQWLRANPKACGQVAVIGAPEIWLRAGLMPVPNGLLYVGATAIDRSEAETLLARNQAFWQRIAPHVLEDPTLRPHLRHVKALLRADASRVANDLGVLLEQLGDAPRADCAYAEALRVDESNVCAVLNRYGLFLRSPALGAPHDLAQRFLALAARPGIFDSFDNEIARGGMLSPQKADTLLPSIIRDYRLGAKPPENMLRLLDLWLAQSQPAGSNDGATFEAAPLLAQAAPDAKFSHAVAVMLEGHTATAEKLLRLLVKNRPDHLSAWSLLAEILMNRGETKEVQSLILPAMRAAAGLGDGTLAEMTEGCLFMRALPPHPKEARACFDRALSLNPTLRIAGDQLLDADRLLGDAAQIEADALKIIARLPDHAGANAILGSLRLGQKRYAESETFLRQSVSTRPTAGALNDLAELLRRQGNTADAEQHARQAVRAAPNFYQAWDTLGNLLLEAGRTDEADGAMHCALAIGPNDPRLYLTLTRLRMKEGQLKEAGQLLDSSKKLLASTSPAVRDEHAQLTLALQSRTGAP